MHKRGNQSPPKLPGNFEIRDYRDKFERTLLRRKDFRVKQPLPAILRDAQSSIREPGGERTSSSRPRLLTVQYVYGDRFRLSITGVTSVPSRVRRLRFLHQEETRRAVTLLRDHGDTASGRVIADYLKHRSVDRPETGRLSNLSRYRDTSLPLLGSDGRKDAESVNQRRIQFLLGKPDGY